LGCGHRYSWRKASLRHRGEHDVHDADAANEKRNAGDYDQQDVEHGFCSRRLTQ